MLPSDVTEVPVPMQKIVLHIHDDEGRLAYIWTIIGGLHQCLPELVQMEFFILRGVSQPFKPCRVATMWGSTADRVENLVANHKIDVRPIGPERVVTRQPEIWTGLPPAVLSANYPISETGVEVSTCPDASSRRRDRYPCVLFDLMQRCGRRI